MMPKALEDALKKQATKKGLKGERKNAYIYGTIAKVEAKKGKIDARGYPVQPTTQPGR